MDGSMLKKAAFAPLVAAALILAAGSARADGADDGFVQAVQSNGLAAYFSSPGDEISRAHRTCTDLKSGGAPMSLAFVLARDQNMKMGQAQSFMNLSVSSYCPEASFPPF
jgi:hypothetical protein